MIREHHYKNKEQYVKLARNLVIPKNGVMLMIALRQDTSPVRKQIVKNLVRLISLIQKV